MKYLLSILLALWALAGYAQGDIPERGSLLETNPPPAGLLRPVYLKPKSKLILIDSKGNEVPIEAGRRSQLFYTWPPYLIQNPVIGDQAMGPSLTADTSQRQYAVYNGARWVDYGQKSTDAIKFGSAFSKAGTTINLNQYPNSIGDIMVDALSLKDAPQKATNPQEHSFILYNPNTGKFERIPYADVLSAFGVNQWPASLGKVGVDALYWASKPSLVTAEGLNLSNAHFLMHLGNSTVIMGMGDYKLFLEKALGLTSGTGSGIKWVNRPDNQNSPGAIGEFSWDSGWLYAYGKKSASQVTQWFRGLFSDVFDNGTTSSEGAPTATGSFETATSKLKVGWSINRTDIISWDVFVSVGDSTHYNLEAGGLAAGLRSQDIQTYGGDKFFVKVRGRLTESGSYTPFSKQIEITRPTSVDAYLPVVNVVLTPLNGSNSIKVDFTTQDGGGEAVVEISSDPNATASAGSWTSAQTVYVSSAGPQSVTFSGINDYNFRRIRIGRQGQKPSSAKQVFGPVSLTSVNDPVFAPTITSIIAATDGKSATINYQPNNTDYTRIDFYRSEDNGATYNLAITTGNSATSYTDENLIPGKTYTYRPQIFKNGAYGPSGEVKSITMPNGGDTDAICNVTDAATGGNQVTTKSYTVTKPGTINYMLDAGLIPDKLTVRKNGVTAVEYTASSWRTAGSMAVITGDKLDFVINPQVTADQGTAWTFYANCSSSHNVDAPQTNFNYANADYPRIASITTGSNSTGGKTFTVNAIPAKNGGSPIVKYKAVMTFSGNTYQDASGWSSSNVLSTDYRGISINANQFYTIYVQDATGKTFAIAEVRDSKVYETDPASQPLQFSINSQTPTSITFTVANPSKPGVILYNWAIYRKDGSTDGKYITNDNDIPSTSSGGVVTINSGKPGVEQLVAGQEYWLYAAQAGPNGMQSQTRNARISFIQPSGVDDNGGGSTIKMGVIPSGLQKVPQGVFFMETDQFKIGINMQAGGSIWNALDKSDPTTELVNAMDLGRLWQYAYYAFPVENYYPNGKKWGHEMWHGIGYDPIQGGDMSVGSRVEQFKYDPTSNTVYFRTRPRLWGYHDIEAPCYVDTWMKLTGNFIEFRNICHNERINDPQYVNLPRGQDIGGMFTNGKYYEDNSNQSNQPWTGPITARKILTDFPFDNYLPGVKHENGSWVYPDMGNHMRSLQFYTPERWTTLRNPETNKYLGLWSQSPLFNHETGGRVQGNWEGHTGGAYVTMGTHYTQAIMDKRTVFDYSYTYMIGGNPQMMRDYAYKRRDFKNVIDWDFSTGHSDWWMNNSAQAETPFDGSWYAPGDVHQSNRVSPDLAIDASKYTHVEIEMAVGGEQEKVGLSFLRRNNNGLLYDHTDVPYQFNIIPDGQMHKYTIKLTDNPNYGGILYRIYLDVFGTPKPGRWSRLKSIKGIYVNENQGGGGGEEEAGQVKEVNPLTDVSLSAVPTYALPANAMNMTADAVPWATQVDYAKRGMVNYVNPGRLANERGGIYHPDWNPNGITEAALQQELASYNLPSSVSLYRMMYENAITDIWPTNQSAPNSQQALNERIEGFAIGYRNSLGWTDHPIVLDIDFEQERFFTYAGVKAQAEAIRYLLSRNPNVRVQVYASAHNNLGVDRGGSASNPNLQISPAERFRLFKEAGVSLFQGTIPYFHVPSYFWTDPSHEPSVIGAGKMYQNHADYAKKSLHPIVAKLGWTDNYFASIPAGHQPANIEWIMAVYEGGNDGLAKQYDAQGNWITGLNWPEVGGWILESLPVWGVVTGSYRYGGGVYNWSDGRPRKVGQDYLEAGKWRAYQFNRFANNPNTQYNIKLEYSMDGGVSWQTDARPDQNLLAEHSNIKPYVRGAYSNGELLIVAVAGQPYHVNSQNQAIKVRYQGKQVSLSLQPQKVHSFTVTL